MKDSRSTVDEPTKLVIALANAIIPLGLQRRHVMDAAIIIGVNGNTANTVFSRWKKENEKKTLKKRTHRKILKHSNKW